MVKYWKFFMGHDSIPGNGPTSTMSIHHIIKWDEEDGYSMYIKDGKWIGGDNSQENIQHLAESGFAEEISKERAKFYIVIL